MATAKALEDRLLGVPRDAGRRPGPGRKMSSKAAWKRPVKPVRAEDDKINRFTGKPWSAERRDDTLTTRNEDVTVRPKGTPRTPGSPSVQNRGSAAANRQATVAKANRMDDRRYLAARARTASR